METRGVLKDRALASLKGNWGTAIVAFIIYAVVACLAGFIPVVGFISFIITIPLGWGFTVFFLRFIRKEDSGFAHLFDGFSDYFRILLTQILTNLYICLWSLLLIVPGIIKGYSYAMTPFILRDRGELQYNGAIEESMRMMDGHKMELFILDLSFIGWALLCILTLGIGFLWLTPYIQTTRAQFYESLKAEQEPVAE